MRLSPDVPIPSADLCEVLYFEDPRTVGLGPQQLLTRFHGVISYGRKVGWDIRLVGGWKFGGMVLGRAQYELVRGAFGYNQKLGGPRVDWKSCATLTPEGVARAWLAAREEAEQRAE